MEHNRDAPTPPGQDLHGLRGATLTARFLCELAMLAALAFWGYVVGEGPWAWLLGVGAPVMAAVAGLVTSLLNESQERRAGPESIRRR